MHVKTIAQRLGRGLKAIWEWCKQHWQDAVKRAAENLNAKLRGHYQYYGRRTNYRAIRQFYRIRTAKHTVDGGREASLEIVRPVSASGSKLWV